jgi:acetamidase/formamidase
MMIGLHKDLDEAAALALGGMHDLMEAQFGWSRSHAMAMASVLVDLRITQVVNGVRGVHAVLDRNAARMRKSKSRPRSLAYCSDE